MEINERIFFLLDKQGKTAKELGDFIKVIQCSISGLEERRQFSFFQIYNWDFRIFNVSIEYLFTGHGSKFFARQGISRS